MAGSACNILVCLVHCLLTSTSKQLLLRVWRVSLPLLVLARQTSFPASTSCIQPLLSA
jgi:hypothetical protein